MAAVPSPSTVLADTPEVHEVEIESFKFNPEVVQVSIGDTIRWTNRDLAPHSATAEEFGWNTQTIERNESAETQVIAGMETSYFCVFHPHMKGKIAIIQ